MPCPAIPTGWDDRGRCAHDVLQFKVRTNNEGRATKSLSFIVGGNGSPQKAETRRIEQSVHGLARLCGVGVHAVEVGLQRMMP